MVDYARIEPETEVHRTEKALKEIAPSAQLPFGKGLVHVKVQPSLRNTPVAQHITSLLVHLLLRMKGIVRDVWIEGVGEVPMRASVPLEGTTFCEGLRNLADSLNGPLSPYCSRIHDGKPESEPDVVVVVGNGDGDIRLGADAWRALIGDYADEAEWAHACPVGPYMAATIGATEVFKRLLKVNFGWTEGTAVTNLAFSLLDYGVDDRATAGPDIASISANDLAIAGAGAGGTAVLYTLASFPAEDGSIVLVEPGVFKESNLNRYLLSTYFEVHSAKSKLESATAFLDRFALGLKVEPLAVEWEQVPARDWGLVVSTVDTPQARWQVQRTSPRLILDGGTMLGTLYAVLRVVPDGWCLECKHPSDPDITWKKRAAMWGIEVEEARARYFDRRPVTEADVTRLADVQGRPAADFVELIGMPFDQVPGKTECGTTPLSLGVPSQAPVLPFATTAAGVVIAAEIVKETTHAGVPLNNYFAHDLRYLPKESLRRFKPRRPGCEASAHRTARA